MSTLSTHRLKRIAGKADPKRTAAILRFYRNGATFRTIAARYSVSHVRIAAIIRAHAPHLIRPRGRPANGGRK